MKAAFALGALLLWSVGLAAQPQTPPQAPAQPAQALPPGSLASVAGVEPSGESSTLTYFNRPIVVLRARALGRRPIERAAGATRILDDLVAEGITGPVESRPIEGGTLISVGSRVVFGVALLDVDELSGETLPAVTAQAVARLQQALQEAADARAPGVLLRGAGLAAAALAFGLLLLWVIGKSRQIIAGKLDAIAEKTLSKSGLADLVALRASHLFDFQRAVVRAVTVVLQLFVLYSLITFVLQRFPYTRPWGESLSGFLLATVETLALGIVNGIPGLFTVLVILVLARLTTRLVALWFESVERGRVKVSWLYPETAVPTRRLVTTLVWMFAIVVAYPYMPGSQTEAFKGVSVFLGLMLTLGSSGIVNHIMSGFMLTYSRAVRVGDFVQIGEVEGTVVQLGVLSTKIKTLMREEVTIPNAVVVAQTTTDYSRLADTEGVLTPISVTIGYDAPWRQIHALLAMAAERTPGLRREPKPHVFQTGLEDFYVRYTLYVSLAHQEDRLVTMDALQSNIQDVFNEYGVQIMSPNYMLDPAAPKVVAKNDWFAAPARPD
jgi:small-conductance mechanosensitive channel